MDKKSLEDNFLYEQFYWWFLGRRKIVRNLIAKFFKKTDSAIALDIGCGTGIVLNDIREHAVPVGIDASEIAITLTKTRGHQNLLCADVCNLPFKDESFDLITTLGVLYNEGVKSDDAAIMESYRVLKKGGIIIIDEAAFNFLQSKHNISVGGVRRYRRSQLINKCKKCGFEILKASYWNMIMLPVFYLVVKLENKFMRQYAKLAGIPKTLNSILKAYLYLEAFLLKYINLPFGPSVIIVGRK
ncbi:MAG: class I SAM-dependent methyltransferase [Nitrospirae bacterium]|nr:class I SAM-dependent methyltransferase [Nitrospirota bacterium]